jgi:hypothetical protein
MRIGGVVHGHAECKDCCWTSESYKNILAVARNHARYYKHEVKVEIGYVYTYSFKSGDK